MLNTALEGRTYLVGNSATIADFSLYAALHPTLVSPSSFHHFDLHLIGEGGQIDAPLASLPHATF